MDINITITSPDLHDAILALAEALNNVGTPFADPAAKPLVSAPIKTAPEPVKAPEEEKAEPVKAEPAAEGPPAITLEDIRKLSMEKSRKDKAAVKAAIAEVGAAKVTEIAEDKYPDYLKLLEAI